MADLLETAGITRVVTIDLHAAQIQGFFNIPFDHMPGGPLRQNTLNPEPGRYGCHLSGPWWRKRARNFAEC